MQKRFSKYLDNEKFMDWIANPSDENMSYWKSFVKENPDEKETIELLKECLSYLRTKDEKLTKAEKEEILHQLNKRIGAKGKTVFHLNVRWLRYAAIAIPLIGLGFYFTINKSNKELELDGIESLLEVSIDSVTSTKLVLTDNSEITIEEKKSEINFGGSDDLIINQKDTMALAQKPVNSEGKATMNQLIVPFGKHSRLTLSDGSLVHLNSGSRLIFPSKFTGSNRQVYLSGEAFFEVESNKNKPFEVRLLKDKEFVVQAVGTKFNVNSYEQNDEVTTVLTEGRVHLLNSADKTIFTSTKKTVMEPGELTKWNVSSKAVVVQKKVNTDYYTSWIDGILMFNSESLQEIVDRIGRYYNVEIEISKEVDNQFRLTGKLDLNESLESTLNNLAVTASIKHKKLEDNEILIFK